MLSVTYSHGSAKTIKIYMYVGVLHAHRNKANVRVLKNSESSIWVFIVLFL